MATVRLIDRNGKPGKRWEVYVDYGRVRRPDGRYARSGERHRFDRKAEAEDKELELRNLAAQRKLYPQTTVTLGQRMVAYLDELVAIRQIKIGTRLGYESEFDNAFGRLSETRLDLLALDEVTREHILNAQAIETERGISGATLQKSHTNLKRFFTYLCHPHVRELRVNPMEGMRTPRITVKPVLVWTDAEAGRFLTTIKGDPLEGVWRLMLEGWLRIGEVQALRWSDLDLRADRPSLQVARTVTRGKAEGRRWTAVIGDMAKTASSHRRLDFSSELAAVLLAEKKRQAGIFGIDEERYVFVNPDGSSFLKQNEIRYRLRLLCAASDVRRLAPHGLRHTGATHGVNSGQIRIDAAQARLGHKTIATTLRYVQLGLEQLRDAADAMARVLAGFAAPPSGDTDGDTVSNVSPSGEIVPRHASRRRAH